MEFPSVYVWRLWNFYQDALKRADKRVGDWPLMFAYWPTFLLTISYLLVIFFGPKLMRNRKPFNFRWVLFFYNAVLVVINFHIFYEIITSSRRQKYSLCCQPVNYSNNPDELRIAKAIWWYYFSKCVEFLDTIFFVLRKKESQITFLHVYHHATMFPLWWIGVKWVAGGNSAFGAMINSFVHVLMYTYYGLSVLGPSVQKYLWWKRYLTRIQLIQFVAGITHALVALYRGCEFPPALLWAVAVYGLTIFVLFSNFYFQAYIKPRKLKEANNANGAAEMNGHLPCSTDSSMRQRKLNGFRTEN